MSSKQGGKLKPLKQAKADKKDYDETDLANIQKKKDEEKALKELRAKASQKGSFGGWVCRLDGINQESNVWTLLLLFLRAVTRVVGSLATRPAAAAATILYHGGALPRDRALERLVCDDVIDCGGDGAEKYIFYFIINIIKCLY
uniref:Translation machinery-associated protein 7 n=1 Tax=Ananas comosus var. bracteatus TaxID=296719 RepID=A0A6V7PA56_ANACO|nr:unnamed protein product [Ananas comosus var. bracteatus]